jgi:hypothetical protein
MLETSSYAYSKSIYFLTTRQARFPFQLSPTRLLPTDQSAQHDDRDQRLTGIGYEQDRLTGSTHRGYRQ